MRPNVHTLSCWNVGVGDASVAGDQSSVDVGDGTDASAWNPLPHCHCHSSTLPHFHTATATLLWNSGNLPPLPLHATHASHTEHLGTSFTSGHSLSE